MRKFAVVLVVVMFALNGLAMAGEISASGSFLRYFGEEMDGRANKLTLGYEFGISSKMNMEFLYSHATDEIAISHLVRVRVKEEFVIGESFSWNWGVSFGVLENSFKEGYYGTGPSTKLLGLLVGAETEIFSNIGIFLEVEGGYTWQELYKGGYYFPAIGISVSL